MKYGNRAFTFHVCTNTNNVSLSSRSDEMKMKHHSKPFSVVQYKEIGLLEAINAGTKKLTF